MPNYEMKFSVSEAANSLETDRELVKKWTYLFSDYLEPTANPPKGIPRQFSADDLRVLAYVSFYWEADPDIEAIKIGLNTGEHHEQVYNDFITALTPLFIDPPDGLGEDWRHGALFGEMAEYGDTFELASSYKIAGDMLVDAALAKYKAFELICPILYNYRHAVELYFKAVIGEWENVHSLPKLLQDFKKITKSEFDATPPEWFDDIIIVFDEFDPGGTSFRYGGSMPGEVWVDIQHVKTLMDWISRSFRKIRNRRMGLRDFD